MKMFNQLHLSFLQASTRNACRFSVRWMDRSKRVPGSHRDNHPNVLASLVNLLYLNL
jgi:hypothetical protein